MKTENKKRYWLRGGVIAIILYIVVSVVLVPFGSGSAGCSGFMCLDFPYWSLPTLLGAALFNYAVELISFGNISLEIDMDVSLIAYAITFYFIAGSLIGLICGKFKNRK